MLALGGFCVLMTVLLACGAQATGQPLSAIHADVDSWSATAATDGFCEECHEAATIAVATQNYDGLSDVNIHEPPADDHTSVSCITCHRVEENPVLTCNQTGCHDYTLPDGWTTLS
jgi:hypothetical protein